MTTPEMPNIDSITELAQFWDAHSITDFEGELVEVAEPVFRRDATIAVHLPETEAAMLRKMASERGLADDELVRDWVIERIHAA